jgi:hypothetical protein
MAVPMMMASSSAAMVFYVGQNEQEAANGMRLEVLKVERFVKADFPLFPLRRVKRSMADMCGVAFVLAVAWVLFIMLLGAPIPVLLILLPSALLCIILKIASRRVQRVLN